MPLRCRQPLLIAATALLGVPIASAAESHLSYGATAAAGYESNPLQVSDNAAGGVFTQLALDASFRRSLDPDSALFISGNARTRLYDTDSSDADQLVGGLRAGYGIAPRGLEGRLALAAGGRCSAGRSTFIDRATGRVYEVSTVADPAETVRIPDRFDYDSYGAFFNARWSQNQRVRLSFDANWERSHYLEDYAENTDLDPLDYRSLTVEPGISVSFGELLTVGASVTLTDLDYDARSALDDSGAAVPGTAREYRYAQYEIAFQLKPANRWLLQLGLRSDDRTDAYAGYNDYGSWSAQASVDHDLTPSSKLRLHASWRTLEYDRAVVEGQPGLIQNTEERTVVGRYERGLGPDLRWFADIGTQAVDSRDPVLAHDQRWVLSGVQFRR